MKKIIVLLIFVFTAHSIIFTAEKEVSTQLRFSVPTANLSCISLLNDNIRRSEIANGLLISIITENEDECMRKIKGFEHLFSSCNEIIDHKGNNLFQVALIQNKLDVADFIIENTQLKPCFDYANDAGKTSYDLFKELEWSREPRSTMLKNSLLNEMIPNTEEKKWFLKEMINDSTESLVTLLTEGSSYESSSSNSTPHEERKSSISSFNTKDESDTIDSTEESDEEHKVSQHFLRRVSEQIKKKNPIELFRKTKSADVAVKESAFVAPMSSSCPDSLQKHPFISETCNSSDEEAPLPPRVQVPITANTHNTAGNTPRHKECSLIQIK